MIFLILGGQSVCTTSVTTAGNSRMKFCGGRFNVDTGANAKSHAPVCGKNYFLFIKHVQFIRGGKLIFNGRVVIKVYLLFFQIVPLHSQWAL